MEPQWGNIWQQLLGNGSLSKLWRSNKITTADNNTRARQWKVINEFILLKPSSSKQPLIRIFPIDLLQICGVTGRSYTYGQLRDHCAALAIRLQQKCKFTPGDTLAICLPNMPEFPLIALGAVEAGLVVTTINPIYTAGKLPIHANRIIIWNQLFDLH